jgi:hypothetical protein
LIPCDQLRAAVQKQSFGRTLGYGTGCNVRQSRYFDEIHNDLVLLFGLDVQGETQTGPEAVKLQAPSAGCCLGFVEGVRSPGFAWHPLV